jgi:lipoate-protein ligase A
MLIVHHYNTLTSAGTRQMALDEYLTLQALERGVASFRWYSWAEPTVSLGYFQAVQDLHDRPALQHCQWVRRSSGGATLVHDPAHELTYALAIPPGPAWRPPIDNWICQMHRYLRSALSHFGVQAKQVACGEEQKLEQFLCFRHQTAGDLLVGQHKVAGSAQRRMKAAIGQHGSINFSQSPITPQVPGIAEVTGVTIDPSQFREVFSKVLRVEAGWALEPCELDATAWEHVARIEQAKYANSEWSHKR